jgi:hypothetical protein
MKGGFRVAYCRSTEAALPKAKAHRMYKLLLIMLTLGLAVPASAQNFIRKAAIAEGSGSITTGGASQQVFPSHPERSYLYCQNPIGASGPLFVNIGAAASTAAGSYELAPGGTMTFQVPFVPTGAVNITAATTGQRFICKAG